MTVAALGSLRDVHWEGPSRQSEDTVINQRTVKAVILYRPWKISMNFQARLKLKNTRGMFCIMHCEVSITRFSDDCEFVLKRMRSFYSHGHLDFTQAEQLYEHVRTTYEYVTNDTSCDRRAETRLISVIFTQIMHIMCRNFTCYLHNSFHSDKHSLFEKGSLEFVNESRKCFR